MRSMFPALRALPPRAMRLGAVWLMLFACPVWSAGPVDDVVENPVAQPREAARGDAAAGPSAEEAAGAEDAEQVVSGPESSVQAAGADRAWAMESADQPEQAAFPGVRNERIRRGGEGLPSINLAYPVLGQPAVDTDIRKWVNQVADNFADMVGRGQAEDGEEDSAGGAERCELTDQYTVARPSAHVVSIAFTLYSYTGGAHGNLEIVCLNYDLTTGRPLLFADIFGKPEKALALMSDHARAVLAKILGDEADAEMIEGGTRPELDNFAMLTLTPEGVLMEFQPYQVGPWSAGPQQVPMSVSQLQAADPSPVVWPDVARDSAGATASSDSHARD